MADDGAGRLGQDDWVFGEKVRGIVRVRVAEVYYNENSTDPKGGWIWVLLGKGRVGAWDNGRPNRGISASLSDAICDAEEAMGIVPE